MRSLRLGALVLVALVIVAGAVDASAQSRSVGQVIDDTSITAEVKAKLVADTLSNLTKIAVSTRNGVVTLSGDVYGPEVKARAVQIASTVKGVRTVVDNIQVAGGPVGAPPPPPTAAVPDTSVDVTGVVSQVDPATGTIILQDGRVLRMTNETMVWQPTTIQSLRPGTPVLVRSAAPVGVQATPSAGWLMGTVQGVDRARSRLVLSDGSVVRLAPGVNIHRGAERLTVEQIVPASEVVFRPIAPSPTGLAEGSASPGTAAVYDAAEINVVWMPTGAPR
jgi:hypothetical protein